MQSLIANAESHLSLFVSLLGAQRNEVSGHRLLGYCHNRSHGHPDIWNNKNKIAHYSPLARPLSVCNWACCIMSLCGTLWRLFWWSIQFPLCSCSWKPIQGSWRLQISTNYHLMTANCMLELPCLSWKAWTMLLPTGWNRIRHHHQPQLFWVGIFQKKCWFAVLKLQKCCPTQFSRYIQNKNGF